MSTKKTKKKPAPGVGKSLGLARADVVAAVKKADGNKVKAAEALGCSRSTVCYHMREHAKTLARKAAAKGAKSGSKTVK